MGRFSYASANRSVPILPFWCPPLRRTPSGFQNILIFPPPRTSFLYLRFSPFLTHTRYYSSAALGFFLCLFSEVPSSHMAWITSPLATDDITVWTNFINAALHMQDHPGQNTEVVKQSKQTPTTLQAPAKTRPCSYRPEVYTVYFSSHTND